jgi:hypothetical protein
MSSETEGEIMHRFIGRKLGQPVLSACAAALVLAGTSGATHLGSLQLGHTNTSTDPTILTANLGSPVLKVVNQGSAAALRGDAQSGIGVTGVSVSGTGQQGESQSGIGLVGAHKAGTGTSPGVQGTTASTDPGGAGVVGKNTGGGPGLKAIVNAGAPPLAVNSNVKVASLNADLLDGLDSAVLQTRVSGTCGAGSAIRVVNANGTVSCEPVGTAGAWGLSGNAGTTPGTNFLGTTDDQALELKVNGARALRLEPGTVPNIVGGWSGNSVTSGIVGATISGGGCPASQCGSALPNQVTQGFGTVGGGVGNTTSGFWATVGGGQINTASGYSATVDGGFLNTASGTNATVSGGENNTASGDYSLAAGRWAKATHDGSFVWADSPGTEVASTAADQVTMRASGGVRLFSSSDTTSADAPGIQLLPGTSALAPAGDNQPLELEAGGARALRIEPGTTPNLIGGSSANSVSSGFDGATIAGGGSSFSPNLAGNFYATIGGGRGNTASGYASTVSGGCCNTASGTSSTVGGGEVNTASGHQSTVGGGAFSAASGDFSFAAGRRAKANHQGAFAWADSTDADFSSTAANQFLVRASGGARFVRGASTFAPTGAALQAENANGSGEAAWFRVGDGSSPHAVVSLIKQTSGPGDFLTCWNETSGIVSTKCHIDSAGTFVAGSDFAESLPVRDGKAGYEPGDVLVASVSHPGEVKRSGKRFDRALIGVYSTRPAVLGADKGGVTRVGKDEIPVAITGIVPVKVTAENGAIKPGDLLTSSSLPGRAMNAGRNPAVGTVLGKSLGALARGRGVIKALVMLR